MDEPLSNLDAKLRGDTRAELVDLHRRLDSTFIYVTHDQVEAMTMGTRVAVLNDGRLRAGGHPAGGVRPAGHGVRRPVHRHAADEPAAAPACSAPTTCRWASGPSTCGSRPAVRCTRTVRQVEHLGHEVLLLADADGAGRLIARLDPGDVRARGGRPGARSTPTPRHAAPLRRRHRGAGVVKRAPARRAAGPS